MSKRKRTRYSDDFKAQAVARVRAGESVPHVASALGIKSDTNLRAWIAQAPKRKAKSTKVSSDIPLEAIPERSTPRRMHTEDFKREAAERVVAGEEIAAVAQDIDVDVALLYRWAKRLREGRPLSEEKKNGAHLDVASALRADLERAVRDRDARLEAAACIVESDGSGGALAELARQIREFKRLADT